MYTGMGQERAVRAVGYLQQLFPRWKTTPELNAQWVRELAKYDAESATAALEGHRAERRGNDPSLPDVRAALERAKRQAEGMAKLGAVERNAATSDRPREPEGLTWQEFAEWKLANDCPTDPVQVEDLHHIAGGGLSRYEGVRRRQVIDVIGNEPGVAVTAIVEDVAKSMKAQGPGPRLSWRDLVLRSAKTQAERRAVTT